MTLRSIFPAVFLLVVLIAITEGEDQPRTTVDAVVSEIPVLMPGSRSVPGRVRPNGLLCVLGDDRIRLSGYPNRIVTRPDGSRLFAVTMTNVVDIIDAKSLSILETFRASDSRVMDVSPSPDGRRLAVAALDGSVTLWDVSSIPARQLSRLETFRATDKKDVWLNLTTSRDFSRFCMSADIGVTVYEWTADGLRTVLEQQVELAFKPSILSPNGKRLVLRTKTPSEFQLLDLNASPATVLDRMEVDARFPRAELFKDDETFLAAASGDGQASSRLVSITGDRLALGKALENVESHPFHAPLFLDDGHSCVAALRKKGPALFACSGEQWEPIEVFPALGGKGPMLLGASPDCRTLYVATDRVLSALTREGDRFVSSDDKQELSGLLGQIDNLAFLRDGTLIFSTHGTIHAVALGEPTRPRPLPPIRLKTPLQGTTYIIPHPTAREFAIIDIGSPGCLIQIRDSGSGFEEIQRFSYGAGPEGWRESPWSAGYSPDGSTLAVGFWNQSIILYTNGKGGLTYRSTTPNAAGGHVCALAFAPDNHSVACGDFGHNARIFAYDGELKSPASLPKFGDAVRHAQFSPDGRLLLLGSQNGEIRLTDLTDDQITRGYRQLLLQDEEAPVDRIDPSGGVSSMQLVANGKLLLTGKGRKGETRVVLWKMPEGKPLQTWTFTGWMRAAIDHDGFMVAVARSDGAVCVIQVSDEVQRWVSGVQ